MILSVAKAVISQPMDTIGTANTYSGKTVEVQWNHCDFEKIQWFTTDHASLYFLPVKVVILALFYIEFNFALNYMQILLVFTAFKNTTKNCKNGAKKL